MRTMRLRQWIERLPAAVESELRLTGSLEFYAEAVAHLDFTKASKVTWLIGPEGDLTSEEYAAARDAGLMSVVLGLAGQPRRERRTGLRGDHAGAREPLSAPRMQAVGPTLIADGRPHLSCRDYSGDYEYG